MNKLIVHGELMVNFFLSFFAQDNADVFYVKVFSTLNSSAEQAELEKVQFKQKYLKE